MQEGNETATAAFCPRAADAPNPCPSTRFANYDRGRTDRVEPEGRDKGGRRQGFLKTSSSWKLLEEQRRLALHQKRTDAVPTTAHPHDSFSVFTSTSDVTALACGNGMARAPPKKPPPGRSKERGSSLVSKDGSVVDFGNNSLSDYSYSKTSDGTAPTEAESSLLWDDDGDVSARRSPPARTNSYSSNEANQREYDPGLFQEDGPRRRSPDVYDDHYQEGSFQDYRGSRYEEPDYYNGRVAADDYYARSPRMEDPYYGRARMNDPYERTSSMQDSYDRPYDRSPRMNDPYDRSLRKHDPYDRSPRTNDPYDRSPRRNDPYDRYDSPYDRYDSRYDRSPPRRMDDRYVHGMDNRPYSNTHYDYPQGRSDDRARRMQEEDRYARAARDPNRSLNRENSCHRRQWEDEQAMMREKQDSMYSRGRQPGAVAVAGGRSQQETVMVEIAPGTRVPLRRSNETMQAIANDMYLPATCFGCTTEILCISDAKYVICPHCKVVSPMEAASVGEQPPTAECFGLGLGFTYDRLFKTQSEILLERSAT